MQDQKLTLKLGDKGIQQSVRICDESITMVASKLYDQVLDGGKSALDIAEFMNFTVKVYEALKNMTTEDNKFKFTDLVSQEIIDHSDDGKTCVTKNGTIVELMEGGTKYNYENCGDPVWNAYNAEMLKWKAWMEIRQKYLQKLTKKVTLERVVAEATGEVFENVEIYPAAKTSTSTFKQTFYKGK